MSLCVAFPRLTVGPDQAWWIKVLRLPLKSSIPYCRYVRRVSGLPLNNPPWCRELPVSGTAVICSVAFPRLTVGPDQAWRIKVHGWVLCTLLPDLSRGNRQVNHPESVRSYHFLSIWNHLLNIVCVEFNLKMVTTTTKMVSPNLTRRNRCVKHPKSVRSYHLFSIWNRTEYRFVRI